MEMYIISVLVLIIAIALIMEWYKKDVRGVKVKSNDEQGNAVETKVTNASCLELKIIALILSAGGTVAIYYGMHLPGTPIMLVVYIPVVYFSQKSISMTIVKKIMKKIVTKYTKLDDWEQ